MDILANCVLSSKVHRTPHTVIPILSSNFQEDLRYDVEVEMELVRPNRASEEIGTHASRDRLRLVLPDETADTTGNFMLSLELRSQRSPETVVISAAQPVRLLFPPIRAHQLTKNSLSLLRLS